MTISLTQAAALTTPLRPPPISRRPGSGGNGVSDQRALKSGPGEMIGDAGPGMLAGLRVVEIADERAEYCGLLLAGLGAEVIKIEPPEGNATRRIGPFLEDQPGLERSLFFWNYNRNKKSVVLDLREPAPCEHLLRLLGGADILLDASCGALNEVLGLDHAALNTRFPKLITARMTPCGSGWLGKGVLASSHIP